MFNISTKQLCAGILALVTGLAGCAQGPSSDTLAPWTAGPVSGQVFVEKLAFPLPPGDWREV